DHQRLRSFPTRRSSDLGIGCFAPVCDCVTAHEIQGSTLPSGRKESEYSGDRVDLEHHSWRCESSIVTSKDAGLRHIDVFSFDERSEEHTSELQSRSDLV